MKKALILNLILNLLIFSNITFADNTALKIGIINSKELENCLYAKDIKKKLEKEFNPKNDVFNAKQKEFQSKGELFERDRAVLSEKERISKERELTKLQQELQHMADSLDIEVKSRFQEELITFNKIVDDAIDKLAKAEKYDLILPDQAVKYSKESFDCTAKIIAEVDAKFKAKK